MSDAKRIEVGDVLMTQPMRSVDALIEALKQAGQPQYANGALTWGAKEALYLEAACELEKLTSPTL